MSSYEEGSVAETEDLLKIFGKTPSSMDTRTSRTREPDIHSPYKVQLQKITVLEDQMYEFSEKFYDVEEKATKANEFVQNEVRKLKEHIKALNTRIKRVDERAQKPLDEIKKVLESHGQALVGMSEGRFNFRDLAPPKFSAPIELYSNGVELEPFYPDDNYGGEDPEKIKKDSYDSLSAPDFVKEVQGPKRRKNLNELGNGELSGSANNGEGPSGIERDYHGDFKRDVNDKIENLTEQIEEIKNLMRKGGLFASSPRLGERYSDFVGVRGKKRGNFNDEDIENLNERMEEIEERLDRADHSGSVYDYERAGNVPLIDGYHNLEEKLRKLCDDVVYLSDSNNSRFATIVGRLDEHDGILLKLEDFDGMRSEMQHVLQMFHDNESMARDLDVKLPQSFNQPRREFEDTSRSGLDTGIPNVFESINKRLQRLEGHLFNSGEGCRVEVEHMGDLDAYENFEHSRGIALTAEGLQNKSREPEGGFEEAKCGSVECRLSQLEKENSLLKDQYSRLRKKVKAFLGPASFNQPIKDDFNFLERPEGYSIKGPHSSTFDGDDSSCSSLDEKGGGFDFVKENTDPVSTSRLNVPEKISESFKSASDSVSRDEFNELNDNFKRTIDEVHKLEGKVDEILTLRRGVIGDSKQLKREGARDASESESTFDTRVDQAEYHRQDISRLESMIMELGKVIKRNEENNNAKYDALKKSIKNISHFDSGSNLDSEHAEIESGIPSILKSLLSTSKADDADFKADELSVRISSLGDFMDDCERKFSDIYDNRSIMSNDLTNLSSRVSMMEKNYSVQEGKRREEQGALQDSVKDLRKQFSDSKESNAAIIKKFTEKLNELECLGRELSRVDNIAEKIQRADRMADEMKAVVSAIKDLESSVKELDFHKERTFELFDEANGRHANLLKQQSDMTSRMDDLESLVDADRKANSKKIREVEDKQDAIELAQVSNDEKLDELDNKQKTFEQKQEANDNKLQEFERKQKNIEQKQKANDNKLQEFERKQKNIEQKQEANDDRLQEFERKQKDLTDHKVMTDRLIQELDTKQKVIEQEQVSTYEKLDELEARQKVFEQEQESANEKLDELDNKQKTFEQKQEANDNKLQEFERKQKAIEQNQESAYEKLDEIEVRQKSFEHKQEANEIKLHEIECKQKGFENKQIVSEERLEEIEKKQKDFTEHKLVNDNKLLEFEDKQKALDKRQISNEDKINDIDLKQKGLEQKQNENEDKIKDLDSRQKTFERKQNENEGRFQDLGAKQKKVEQRQNESEDKLKDLDNKQKVLEHKHNDSEARLHDIDNMQKVIHEQQDKCAKSILDLQNANSDLRELMDSFNKAVEDSPEEYFGRLLDRLEEIEGNIEGFETVKDDVKRLEKGREADLAGMDNIKKELNEITSKQAKDAERRIEDLERVHKQDLTHIKQLEEKMGDLNDKLTEALSSLSDLAVRFSKRDRDISSLQGEHDFLKKEHALIRDKLIGVLPDEESSKYQSKLIQQSEKEIQTIKTAMKKLVDSQIDALENCNSLGKRVTDLEKQNKTCMQLIDQKSQYVNEENDKLREKMQDMDNRFGGRFRDNEEALEKLNSLNKLVANTQTDNTEMLEKLIKRLSAVEVVLKLDNSQSHRISEIEKRIERLDKRLSDESHQQEQFADKVSKYIEGSSRGGKEDEIAYDEEGASGLPGRVSKLERNYVTYVAENQDKLKTLAGMILPLDEQLTKLSIAATVEHDDSNKRFIAIEDRLEQIANDVNQLKLN